MKSAVLANGGPVDAAAAPRAPSSRVCCPLRTEVRGGPKAHESGARGVTSLTLVDLGSA
ncbi:MAG: hypothetical protein IJ131_05245 [Eggerthellaceae bacterium]|nr:hypothetical protein [Eggerthellaceae bacterium]